MGAKIATFIVTLVLNIAIGVVVFFFMLIAMNGFSESDANYGIGAYIVLGLLVSLAMSAAAAMTVHLLTKREFRSWIAGLIAVPLFSLIGGGLKFVCCIIGLLIAEYVRVNY
jgi:hypothetical protein